MAEEYVLLYDGDCRLCSASARWVSAVDVHGRIRIRPIQASRELLPGSGDDILDAMHVVAPDGRVWTGGEAVPAILAALSGARAIEPLLRASPAATSAMHVLYSLMVELRGHLTCRYDAAAPPADQ